MAAPKFANVGCYGDQGGRAGPTGRQLTLPRSGQQSPLSAYGVQALSHTWGGSANGQKDAASLSPVAHSGQLSGSGTLHVPQQFAQFCSLADPVCFTPPGQDPTIYSAASWGAVAGRCCPVDHSVAPHRAPHQHCFHTEYRFRAGSLARSRHSPALI